MEGERTVATVVGRLKKAQVDQNFRFGVPHGLVFSRCRCTVSVYSLWFFLLPI